MISCAHEPAPGRVCHQRCRYCTRPIIPVLCTTCNGEGETWSRAEGWHDCPDCKDGLAKWIPAPDE